MKFNDTYVTIGTTPQMDWVGKNHRTIVKFSGAENHNKNVGTKEKPDYVNDSTSWYNFVLWGDTAEKFMETNPEQGKFYKVAGFHKINKVQTENEKPKYYPEYTITEFELIKKKDG